MDKYKLQMAVKFKRDVKRCHLGVTLHNNSSH